MASKRTQPEKGNGGAGDSFTLQEVKALVQALEGTDVTGLVWARGAQKVVIRRGQQAPAVTQVVTHAAPVAAPIPAMAPAAPAAAAPAAAKSEKPGTMVTSPFVGTFYRAPSPDSKPYCDVGSVVKKGQVLCIVEAMKLMNEIEAEVDGRVAEILAQNATPVEFGQPLFRIEPA
jgi:acetyl-CoA carboxylase biotin carboxyl carrier protein